MRKQMKVLVFSFFFIIISLLLRSQNFVNPVKIPLLLSGSFAELRNNHFHSGIDIKTNEKTGIPVIAIADGYVSRIKVSPYGFGKVLYITHYNGYMSVYAHLLRFEDSIWKFVREEQYKQHKNSIELFPKKTKIQIHQGDTIGFTGNSGSSGGPHLHFEIRKKNNQHPVNPVKIGFDIKDTIAPVIYKLSLTNFPNYTIGQRVYKCSFKKEQNNIMVYSINPETLKIKQPIGIAIKTYDYYNNSTNICGINAIKMYLDDKIFFGYQLDEFSYSKKRYINSLVDFPYYIRKKERFQRLYRQPNNQLSSYFPENATGKIQLKDTLLHKIKIVVTDSKNNTAMLSFFIQGPTTNKQKTKKVEGKLFRYQQINKFENDTFSFTIPQNGLYDDMVFTYKMISDNRYFSPIITIGSEEIPLHKKATLSITVGDKVKPKYRSKLTIVRKSGKRFYNAGGYYRNGKITVKTYNFGTFAVSIDTIPPVIKPLNIYENAKFIKDTSIRFQISDNLSGIQSYSLFIDGKWLLLDYDYKTKELIYVFDNYLEKSGKLHKLQLIVIDGKGNTSHYATNFYY